MPNYGTCKNCGKTRLIWTKRADGSWFLLERNAEHSCKNKPKGVTCKLCGKKNLKWEKTLDGKWFLSDNGRTPHKCNPEVTCKYCGKGGFKWKKEDDKLFLVDRSGNRHMCWRK